MKYAIVLAALSTLAAAQSVFISAPQAQSTLTPGKTFVVDITRVPNFIVSTDVSVAIGIQAAGTTPVDANNIGNVLFAGPYRPQGEPGVAGLTQNYTVVVPANMPPGNATVFVAHFFLLGSSVSAAWCVG
ncbi:hypothetical protein C2E23DRAFT_732712 [Lenzites betulinus]|nr:hypothetical protein C2E23DRAFT_732712 [Lenzites betulinus]